MKNILGVSLLSILLMTACNLGSTSSSSSGGGGGGGSSGKFTITNLESTVVLGSGCSRTASSLNFVCSAASSSMAVNNVSYTSSPASYLFIPGSGPKGVTITPTGNCATEPVSNYGPCSIAFSAESATKNSTVYILLTNSPLTPTTYQVFISIAFQ